MEHLAWASVQINGYCKTQQQIKSPTQNFPQTPKTTSLNIHENSIIVTDPKILFCDLRLASGESRTYYYREQVPSNCPPTYRGIDIKYYYKVSIATQRVGSRVQLLQVPIRVLPLLQIEDSKAEALPPPCDDITNEELSPTNPFLENDRKVVSKIELALENLQNVTARRRPNFYVITNRRGKVGRFCLFKPCYKLGEDIVGTLDFTCRTVRCVQLSVTLQSEEILANSNKLPKSPTAETPPTGKITNFTKHHEICIGLMQTQMILPIPLHVTPSFSTDLVDVRWRLHFQFVTTTSEDLMLPEEPSEDTWNGPKNIDIETMVWNLPIKIHSTNPTQIFQPQSTN
jgi:hypothetical protein